MNYPWKGGNDIAKKKGEKCWLPVFSPFTTILKKKRQTKKSLIFQTLKYMEWVDKESKSLRSLFFFNL